MLWKKLVQWFRLNLKKIKGLNINRIVRKSRILYLKWKDPVMWLLTGWSLMLVSLWICYIYGPCSEEFYNTIVDTQEKDSYSLFQHLLWRIDWYLELSKFDDIFFLVMSFGNLILYLLISWEDHIEQMDRRELKIILLFLFRFFLFSFVLFKLQ